MNNSHSKLNNVFTCLGHMCEHSKMLLCENTILKRASDESVFYNVTVMDIYVYGQILAVHYSLLDICLLNLYLTRQVS
jgi:hypothetical protein